MLSAPRETVADVVQRRGITEIVHFTSNEGLVHILKDGAVRSREQLQPQFWAENVMNARKRWDTNHFDYISLSISWINAAFFDICANKWHAETDRFWVLLSFDASILEHDDVLFTTTNNGYEPNVRRAPGASGLEALFAPRIAERATRHVDRLTGLPARYPTCPQAEALYHRTLSLEYLRRVYVYDPELHDVVSAQAHTVHRNLPEIVIDPARFGQRPVTE